MSIRDLGKHKMNPLFVITLGLYLTFLIQVPRLVRMHSNEMEVRSLICKQNNLFPPPKNLKKNEEEEGEEKGI